MEEAAVERMEWGGEVGAVRVCEVGWAGVGWGGWDDGLGTTLEGGKEGCDSWKV